MISHPQNNSQPGHMVGNQGITGKSRKKKPKAVTDTGDNADGIIPPKNDDDYAGGNAGDNAGDNTANNPSNADPGDKAGDNAGDNDVENPHKCWHC
jgi:hypothetical protein